MRQPRLPPRCKSSCSGLSCNCCPQRRRARGPSPEAESRSSLPQWRAAAAAVCTVCQLSRRCIAAAKALEPQLAARRCLQRPGAGQRASTTS